MTIKTISNDSVMLYFEQTISEKVLDEVQEVYQKLKELKGIIDITPSYASILVIYKREIYNQESIKATILKRCLKDENSTLDKRKTDRLIEIPTNYSKNLDLKRVAEHNNLTINEVIELHTQRTYRVYAIGFMVGFAYLATVDEKITTPRLSTPRAKIPKGSVAIADSQTAIYPEDSAGGWNIIGYTDFNAFEKFSVGDSVRFMSI